MNHIFEDLNGIKLIRRNATKKIPAIFAAITSAKRYGAETHYKLEDYQESLTELQAMYEEEKAYALYKVNNKNNEYFLTLGKINEQIRFWTGEPAIQQEVEPEAVAVPIEPEAIDSTPAGYYRLLFDDCGFCLGGDTKIDFSYPWEYTGNYWSSTVLWLPENYNPQGKHLNKLRELKEQGVLKKPTIKRDIQLEIIETNERLIAALDEVNKIEAELRKLKAERAAAKLNQAASPPIRWGKVEMATIQLTCTKGPLTEAGTVTANSWDEAEFILHRWARSVPIESVYDYHLVDIVINFEDGQSFTSPDFRLIEAYLDKVDLAKQIKDTLSFLAGENPGRYTQERYGRLLERKNVDKAHYKRLLNTCYIPA